MRRRRVHLALAAVLLYTSGAATAAHQALAHQPHEDHGSTMHTDCGAWHASALRAADAPPPSPLLLVERLALYTLTTVCEPALCLGASHPAQPRAPPTG